MELHTISYRLGQVRQQLGFVTLLSAGEFQEIAQWLSPSALALFQSMSPADQRHSLRVCRSLQTHGCTDTNMLTAALLHDVGKAQGRVPFWTRPVIVLGKKLAPRLLTRLVVYPVPSPIQADKSAMGAINRPLRQHPARLHEPYHAPTKLPHWRRSLSYAWYHAEVGAELAAAAGLSEQTVLYIRTHHQPNGPAAELHQVDEVS